MNKRIGLQFLPYEVVELIVQCDVITYKDICRLCKVSKLFYSVGQNNKLWKMKFAQMWPLIFPLYTYPVLNWKHEFSLQVQHRSQLLKRLKEISVNCYYQSNVSEESLVVVRDVCEGHPLTDFTLIDELESIIHSPECHKNLTIKYYAMKALRYVKHKKLGKIWTELLKGDQSKLTLLKGACLLSQWCQPIQLNCTGAVCSLINTIIQLVHQKLKADYPKNPASLKTTPVLLNEDDAERLEDSLWDPRESRPILYVIADVIFNQLKFRGNADLFSHVSHSFIDEVLKTKVGIPVTLGIVLEVVAAKFGVKVCSVNFPGRFLLKWKEQPHFLGPEAYTFIDLYEGGKFKTYSEIISGDLSPGYDQFSSSWLDIVSPLKVLVRMCWNIVEIGRQRDAEEKGMLSLCDALELLYLLSPDDVEHKLLLARLYTHLCINTEQVMNLLQEVTAQDPNSASIVSYMYRTVMTTNANQKSRLAKKAKTQSRCESCAVDYAIGMVMTHLKYGYRCVIYGWDPTCTASHNWITQMRVKSLPKQDRQPFYHVLVEDGTTRYAAQENLSLDTTGGVVPHFEIGKYFESFHGWYYEPNDLKRQQYPDDADVRERFRIRAEQPEPQGSEEDVDMACLDCKPVDAQ